MQELVNIVAKVAQDNLTNLRAQQVRITTQVQDHLNKLKMTINDIKDTVEAKTYGADPNVPLITPMVVSSIKLLIERQTLGANEETSAGPCDSSAEI